MTERGHNPRLRSSRSRLAVDRTFRCWAGGIDPAAALRFVDAVAEIEPVEPRGGQILAGGGTEVATAGADVEPAPGVGDRGEHPRAFVINE